MSVEVLSPAGSMESLIAAVRAGADAVYLGVGSFNARKNAKNFDDGMLADAVAYCHMCGVKVYLTLNTLASDSELSDALKTAQKACALGVDGVIIQDLGLAALLRAAAPRLALHASTQMSVHTPATLKLLKEMGFCRVVAAREMSRGELTLLCATAAELSMEVEVFVHGALCMCVSGQCYLSAMLGGRSGNRGLCAQPCRLPFSVEGGTGHDLSLKDLSLIDKIPELTRIGVASFKIEGRMKRPEYVAAATAACRYAADGLAVPQSLSQSLQNIFSRSGFTDGYYMNAAGVDMFGYRTKSDEIATVDTLGSLHSLYRDEVGRVPLTGAIKIESEKPAEFCIKDGVHSINVKGPVPEKAINKPVSLERVKEQLSKLGGTPYYMSGLECRINDGLTLPMSALNAMRREAAEQLTGKRKLTLPVPFIMPDIQGLRKSYSSENQADASIKEGLNQQLIARFADTEQLSALSQGEYDHIAAISLPLECGFADIDYPDGLARIIDIPRGIFGKDDWVRGRLKKAKYAGFDTALCGNLSAVSLARECGLGIICDFGMNLYNSASVNVAKTMGVKAVILSPELTLNGGAAIDSGTTKGMVIYGRLPLMLTRNCPLKNGNTDCGSCGRNSSITDRKGITFPVLCRAGYAEILNSRPIWMADRMEELKKIDFCVLYFTNETGEECKRILTAYRSSATPNVEFTRGMMYRGVE